MITTGIGAYAAHNEARNPSRELKAGRIWVAWRASSGMNPHRTWLKWHATPMSRDQLFHRRMQGFRLHCAATVDPPPRSPEQRCAAWASFREMADEMLVIKSLYLGVDLATEDDFTATHFVDHTGAAHAVDAMALAVMTRRGGSLS